MNADVVDLLTGMDWDRSVLPDQLFHEGGEPFTEAEVQLFLTATLAEWQACDLYFNALLEFSATQADHARHVVRMTAPYYAMPDVTTLADVQARMSDAELAALQPHLDAIAPDGNLFFPNGRHPT